VPSGSLVAAVAAAYHERMADDHQGDRGRQINGQKPDAYLKAFGSEVVDRVRAAGNVWRVGGGQLLLPRVFGFCRGVERALAMLEHAIADHAGSGTGFFLLGQIIHNPWVNEYFRRRGVRILSPSQLRSPRRFIAPSNCAVVPAFGVPPQVQRDLDSVGCRVIDTTCGDVRRLWAWSQRAAGDGFGVLIFGRAGHDETVVTKSRLAEMGGRYLVIGSVDNARLFCALIAGESSRPFRDLFDSQATNAETIEPFARLAQVSQTTMLYDETVKVRGLIADAFARRYGPAELPRRVLFHPTVCRATQQRQDAAVELCSTRPELVIVVGGFGSSNTRHLYELASGYTRALFIESAADIRSAQEINMIDPQRDEPVVVRNWLPPRRPLRIAVLAGASSPEIVVGEVLRRLAELLS